MSRSSEVALVYFVTLCMTWIVAGMQILLIGGNLLFAAMSGFGVLAWSFVNLFFVLLPAMLLVLRWKLRSPYFEAVALIATQPLIFAAYMVLEGHRLGVRPFLRLYTITPDEPLHLFGVALVYTFALAIGLLLAWFYRRSSFAR